MSGYSRMLDTDILVEHFVDNVLRIADIQQKVKAINAIAAAERNIRDYDLTPTLTHRDNRDFRYRDDNEREELRTKIVTELADIKRLSDDELICLGKGGAKPLTDVKSERKAFYVIGPPASGKSGISSRIADMYGAYILDSDYAKRKLPEYQNQIGAATLVHEESSSLIFDRKEGNLMDYCVSNGYNIIIPKIGDKIGSINRFCSALKQADYKVYLVSIELDRQKSTVRAYNRYVETGRYVPLSLVFDAYGNQPTLNYFKLRQQSSGIFSGFAQITTDVPRGNRPILLEQSNMKDLEVLFGGVDNDK